MRALKTGVIVFGRSGVFGLGRLEGPETTRFENAFRCEAGAICMSLWDCSAVGVEATVTDRGREKALIDEDG